MSRRAVLRGVGLGAVPLLTGCSLFADDPAPAIRRDDSPTAPRPDPDLALAVTALTDERAALDALRATLAVHRGMQDTLVPMIEAHRAHVSLLARAAPDDAPDSSDAAGRGRSRFAVPADPSAARAKIRSLQTDLSVRQKRHAFAARSGAFARVLASMAAAAAQQASVLPAPPSPEKS